MTKMKLRSTKETAKSKTRMALKLKTKKMMGWGAATIMMKKRKDKLETKMEAALGMRLGTKQSITLRTTP